jgi:hypothetical protein
MKTLSSMPKNDPIFRDKVYRLLAELLADQMGGTLVSLEFVDEPKEKEAGCG